VCTWNEDGCAELTDDASGEDNEFDYEFGFASTNCTDGYSQWSDYNI